MIPHTAPDSTARQQTARMQSVPQPAGRPPSLATSRAFAASIAARPRSPLPLRPASK